MRKPGFKHTPETIEKLKKAAAGRPSPMQGKKMSDEHKAKIAAANRGRKLTAEHKASISGENSGQWKGDKVKYRALHNWVDSKLGRPQVCSNCKTTTAKKYEWANLSHEYQRSLDDWARLCTSCHRYYDSGKLIIQEA